MKKFIVVRNEWRTNNHNFVGTKTENTLFRECSSFDEVEATIKEDCCLHTLNAIDNGLFSTVGIFCGNKLPSWTCSSFDEPSIQEKFPIGTLFATQYRAIEIEYGVIDKQSFEEDMLKHSHQGFVRHKATQSLVAINAVRQDDIVIGNLSFPYEQVNDIYTWADGEDIVKNKKTRIIT